MLSDSRIALLFDASYSFIHNGGLRLNELPATEYVWTEVPSACLVHSVSRDLSPACPPCPRDGWRAVMTPTYRQVTCWCCLGNCPKATADGPWIQDVVPAEPCDDSRKGHNQGARLQDTCGGGRQADFKSPPGSDSEFFGLCSQSQGKALGTTFYVIFWKTLYMRPAGHREYSAQTLQGPLTLWAGSPRPDQKDRGLSRPRLAAQKCSALGPTSCLNIFNTWGKQPACSSRKRTSLTKHPSSPLHFPWILLHLHPHFLSLSFF